MSASVVSGYRALLEIQDLQVQTDWGWWIFFRTILSTSPPGGTLSWGSRVWETTAQFDLHLVCLALTECKDSFSVESTLEYWSGCWTACVNGSSLSFERWTSGSYAVTSASIIQKTPMPQNAISIWMQSLIFSVAKCSGFTRVLVQLVLQWWLHMY